jgi:hypothetical protein
MKSRQHVGGDAAVIRTGDGDEDPVFSGWRIDLRGKHSWILIATQTVLSHSDSLPASTDGQFVVGAIPGLM